MSEWESWVTEAEDQLATVRVMSPAPARPSALGPAGPGAAAISQFGPPAPTTTRPESAARGFADEREVEQWAAAARRLRFGEETVRAASKTSAASASRAPIVPTSTTFAATETNPSHSPRWMPFSPFVASSHAAEDRRVESPGDLIDLRTPIVAEMDPGARHDDPFATMTRDELNDGEFDDDESALERLNLVNARLRDAVATRTSVDRGESAASPSRDSTNGGRSRYGEDAVAEWWADCHWRARTVARCAEAWRETTRRRIARERRVLAEKAAELAALARAREQTPRAVARRAWRAMEAADRRAGRSSLSPCPAATQLAPTPTRSRTALVFELAASLELADKRGSGSIGDAFGSPTTLADRDGTNPPPSTLNPPPSPLSPLNIAAIEREHEALRNEEEMESLRGADLWDVRDWMRNHAAAALSAWRAETARGVRERHSRAVADAGYARRRCATCLSGWARWAAIQRRDRRVTETYAARNSRRTKGRLMSRWRDKVACGKSVRESVAFALEQHRRRNLLPAFKTWRVFTSEERTKGEEAATRWFRVCAGSMLQQWRRFAADTRREREWLEFADSGWRRKTLRRSLGNWARFADAAIAAAEEAEARASARMARIVDAAFAEWRRRAAHIAASYELVRLACLQWRHERTSAAFRVLVDAGKSHRALLDAVGADADVAHVARRFAAWKEAVAAALAEYGPAMDAMLACVLRVRLARTMRAFRAHAAESRDIAADRSAVMTRRKRARVYDAWWHVTAATARFNAGALAQSAGMRRRFQTRLAMRKLLGATTAQRGHRDAIHVRAEGMDARARCSRTMVLWSANARDVIHARNQWMAAVHHRDVKILRAWAEWRREIRVTFAERKRTSGRNAMRRVAITFAVWYEFMREMRSLRRPMLKYIESQQQTRGGVWHGGRFIGPGTTPAEKAKRLALARLKARRRLDTHVKFANHSLSYVGPCIEAAARSRCGRMMKHLRARQDFDSVADWYGLRWENMMENKYLFAWTGVGIYSGTDLGTSAVDVDVDTEPGPSGEAFDESAEPSPVEKFDAAADESAVYLEPLDLDGSRRLADAADASSIDGTSFYVTPAMTPAASPAPKPQFGSLNFGADDAERESPEPKVPETKDAIRRLRDVAALARGATETGGVSVTWSPSKPPIVSPASRPRLPLEIVAEASVESPVEPPVEPPPSKTLPAPRADPKSRSQLEAERAAQEKERKLAKRKSKGK